MASDHDSGSVVQPPDLPDAGQLDAAESALRAIIRGLVVGAFAIAAMAIWAMSLEPILSGQAQGGFLIISLRVLICDAIPLAILIALYQSLGKKETCESTARRMLCAIFWFRRPNRRPAWFDEHVRELYSREND